MDGQTIALVLELKELVKELQTDWEFLSEERDRWGRTNRFGNSASTNRIDLLIQRHVEDFEQKHCDAVRLELNSIEMIRDLLEAGLQIIRRIKSGKLLAYSIPEGRAMIA